MIKKFDEYIKALDDINDYKSSILPKIDDYIESNLTHIKNYKKCFDFYIDHDNNFIVKFFTLRNDPTHVIFKNGTESYNKIIKYLDSLELYLVTKKYNL